MQKIGRARRWIVGLALSLAIAVGALFVVIQVGQRVERHRAERLLAQMQALQLDKSTWSDAQRLMTQWGAWGSYDGRCDAQSCEYSIAMVDRFLPGVAWLANLSGAPCNPDPPIMHLLKLFHANLPIVRASISIHNDRVAGIWFSVYTNVPKGYGPGWTKDDPHWTDTPEQGYMEYKNWQYDLVATAHSSSQPNSTVYWPSQLAPHPDYWVGRPGGCEGCMGFITEFTAATKRGDLNWLMSFDLSCMTRWTPCTVPRDLMPAAWSRYVVERENTRRLQHCTYSPEELTRAAEEVAVVQVSSIERDRDGELHPSIRLVDKLKGADAWPRDQPRQLIAGRYPDQPLQTPPVGSKLIVLYANATGDAQRGYFILTHDCGVIAATDENLRQIKAGLSEQAIPSH